MIKKFYKNYKNYKDYYIIIILKKYNNSNKFTF